MQTQLTLNLGIDEKVDVRSLIVHGDIERETPRAKREQPMPEFERVLMDGADCAFRRTAVLAASIATLPPPISATFFPVRSIGLPAATS